MRAPDRPRWYVKPLLLSALRPAFRYCERRRAYVLRLFGQRLGPVLRADRRGKSSEFDGPERRGLPSEEEAFNRVW